MSEENVLLPKSRYDKLVGNSEKQYENNKTVTNGETSVQDSEQESVNTSLQKSPQQFNSKSVNEEEFQVSKNQSPGRTVEDISMSSVPHLSVRPPGEKILSEKIKNETKPSRGKKKRKESLNLKKNGKKIIVKNKAWIKW